MSQGVLVFTKDHNLYNQLGHQMGPEIPLIPVKTMQNLQATIDEQPVRAVLVHMNKDTLEGHTPGRFIAELNDAVDTAPIYGLVDPDCPQRLRKLASRSADDCLNLPVDIQRLKALLSDENSPINQLDELWKNVPHRELHGATKSMVTFTPEMFEMIDELEVAARHNVTALLIGETGSGKTTLARLIHEISDRREHRFFTVACGALPADLIDSELFGHKKGSFTGADSDREGKFAATGKGTLLLDEIDVLPLDQQAKLLRVIETGEYEAVGSNDTRKSEARLIVASNYNLEDLVRSGAFRTDLYYRLNILNFRLPPLRERPIDIEYLARKFAIEQSAQHGVELREIEPGFIDTLRKYPWPGNIREMENVIRRAVLYCKRGVLGMDDLPSSIRRVVNGTGALSVPIMSGVIANQAANRQTDQMPSGQGYPGFNPASSGGNRFAGSSPVGVAPSSPMLGYNAGYDPGQGYAAQQPQQFAPGTGAVLAGPSIIHPTLGAHVDTMERRMIEDTLVRNNHRRKETAAALGISRVTLYNKMKKFGLL
jgi:DNA-binding NtrC family response regulator